MDTPRKISFILLISFTIIVAHNLVPHHHHSESLVASPTHSCPIDHQDHRDSQDGRADTYHCHALNNIVFVNYHISAVPVAIKMTNDLFIAHTIFESEWDHSNASSGYTFLTLPIYSIECQGTHFMRGPPSIV
jgi:hypothetical protein